MLDHRLLPLINFSFYPLILCGKEGSPGICSVVLADAWKQQSFRNICILLAIQLVFIIFLVGSLFWCKWYLVLLYFSLICQISVEETDFFCCCGRGGKLVSLVLQNTVALKSKSDDSCVLWRS